MQYQYGFNNLTACTKVGIIYRHATLLFPVEQDRVRPPARLQPLIRR